MANRYGEAALTAVKMDTFGKALTPAERWDDAVAKLYPSSAGRNKKQPRAAFAGLCEAGLVKGLAHSGGMSTDRNAWYAVQAVDLLKAGTHKTVSQLWAAVTAAESSVANTSEVHVREHANQMDVVLALWKNNLII